MAESVIARPAAPAEEGRIYGGFADIARRLNTLHPERPIPFSRQLVERWYKCRTGPRGNGFPERQPVDVGGGRVRPLFDLQLVERWHTSRTGHASPPIETIPLFNVDQHGHPIDAEQASYRGHPGVREDYRSSVLDL